MAKITAVEIEPSKLEEKAASELFDKIQEFASYSFNRSHATAYAILSYWSAYAKIRHPAEFFAAALTILDEDKRPSIVKNAEERGLVIMPPDINISSRRFEIRQDSEGRALLYAPFQLVKGVSEKGAEAIMKAREACAGPFKSKEEFVAVVNRRQVNIRVQEALDKIGAFAVIEGQIDPRDPERLKDQKVLLPGLMSGNVRVDRGVKLTPEKLQQLEELMHDVAEAGTALEVVLTEARRKKNPEADPKVCLHPLPHFGKDPQIMIVMDHPNWSEVNDCVMGSGDACSYLLEALKINKISLNNVYITALVKCGKDKGEDISNPMINAYSDLLDREIGVVNSPIIVALGTRAIRHLMPDVKGGWEELCGQVHYDPGKDATIIFGMNPTQIFFEPSRQRLLDDVFAQAKKIIAMVED